MSERNFWIELPEVNVLVKEKIRINESYLDEWADESELKKMEDDCLEIDLTKRNSNRNLINAYQLIFSETPALF